jgi:hypothetical protein
VTDKDQASLTDRHPETTSILTDECTVMVQELIAFVIKERNDLTEEINRVYGKAIADNKEEIANLRQQLINLNGSRTEPTPKTNKHPNH